MSINGGGKMERYNVGDVLRMKHYPTSGGWRCWKVVGVHLGHTFQEGTYELFPLDVWENMTVHVPCIMLETHSQIFKV